MSYYDKRDYNQYNNYQSDSRRNSNSFSEDQSAAKRKKKWPRKRGGNSSGPGRMGINADTTLFKEPPVPAFKRYASSSPGQHPYRSEGGRGQGSQPYFDMRDMPDFVESQHSGAAWHWDNYFHNCKAWQEKHKLAYYRSRCLALEFENQMLFEQINSLIEENCVFAAERGLTPTMRLPEIPMRQGPQSERGAQPSNAQTTPKKQGKKDKASDTSDSQIEFVVTEDMMNFLEKSIRHKLSLKKKRSREGEQSKGEDLKKKEGEVKRDEAKQPVGQKRMEDHDQLYGKNSALIQGLETSVQLNFNRICDTHKPEMWMVTPLNPENVIA